MGIDWKGQGWKWEDHLEGSWNNKVSSDRGLNLTGTGGSCSGGWILDILKVEDRICQQTMWSDGSKGCHHGFWSEHRTIEWSLTEVGKTSQRIDWGMCTERSFGLGISF